MFAQEREKEIMEILLKKKAVTVNFLSKSLYISEATVRRDLARMDKSGLLRRTHGGAVIMDGISDEPSLLIREQEYINEKQYIGSMAIKYINPNNTIFMDSSSTVGEVIPYLNQKMPLTIITNGLKNAMRLSMETDADIYMAGGGIEGRSKAALDGDSVQYLENRYADVVMFSCSGVDLNNGITDVSPKQSRIKQIMIKNSKFKILLCTKNKFNQTFMCKTASFSDIDLLITDSKPDKKTEEMISSSGCKIVY